MQKAKGRSFNQVIVIQTFVAPSSASWLGKRQVKLKRTTDIDFIVFFKLVQPVSRVYFTSKIVIESFILCQISSLLCK